MANISLKIAYPIIIAGLFIMVSFIALNYQSLSFNFYIVLSLLIAYIFLFGFAIGQNFASPVKKLLKRADDLSRGDLKSRFYFQSKDELGELAKVFNKIAEDFEQSKYKNETADRLVDIKVKARTEALEEVINALEQKVKNRTLELERISTELEKFKNQPNIVKDEEISDLKNQMQELKKEMGGRSAKKEKLKKASPELE